MTVYTLHQPVAGDDLSISQPKLAANCDALDAIYGFDHVPFSNTSMTQGFHNTVTTPAYQNPIGTFAASPPTSTTYPILYSFQPLTGANGTPTTKLGLMQYSVPTPNNATTNPFGYAVPTPLTSIQSPATGSSLASGVPLTIFNFAGIPRAYGFVFAVDMETVGGFPNPFVYYNFIFDGTTLTTKQIILTGTNVMTVSQSGTNLQLINGLGSNMIQVYWTIQFMRNS